MPRAGAQPPRLKHRAHARSRFFGPPHACRSNTLHRRIPEAVDELNQLLRGWSGYFHFRQSARVFGKTQDWVRDRLRRWLWRKHDCTKALWGDYPNKLLHDRYGLWRLPLRVSWKTH